ncbi:1371_t:CDS:2, partial [Acaulospora morrowiae]
MTFLKPYTHDQNDAETASKVAVTASIFTSPLTYLSQQARALLIKILRQGPIPQHIGFIMDGNRRFARKMNRLVVEGHYMGYNAMYEMLDICLHLGVKVVTVYAFSIENFKRPPEEVNTLMELARIKMVELCEK